MSGVLSFLLIPIVMPDKREGPEGVGVEDSPTHARTLQDERVEDEEEREKGELFCWAT